MDKNIPIHSYTCLDDEILSDSKETAYFKRLILPFINKIKASFQMLKRCFFDSYILNIFRCKI